jgi:hypothetical protein
MRYCKREENERSSRKNRDRLPRHRRSNARRRSPQPPPARPPLRHRRRLPRRVPPRQLECRAARGTAASNELPGTILATHDKLPTPGPASAKTPASSPKHSRVAPPHPASIPEIFRELLHVGPGLVRPRTAGVSDHARRPRANIGWRPARATN